MPEPLPPSRWIPLVGIIVCIGIMLTRPSPGTNMVLGITALASFGMMVALERTSPVMTELVRHLAGRRRMVEPDTDGPEDTIDAATEFVQRMADLLARFDDEEAAVEVEKSTAEPKPVAEVEVDLTEPEPEPEPEPVLESPPRRILSDAEVFAATRGPGFRAHPWSDQAYPSP